MTVHMKNIRKYFSLLISYCIQSKQCNVISLIFILNGHGSKLIAWHFLSQPAVDNYQQHIKGEKITNHVSMLQVGLGIQQLQTYICVALFGRTQQRCPVVLKTVKSSRFIYIWYENIKIKN